jgi:hypothetical protein
MKNIFNKIENFLVSTASLLSFFIGFSFFDKPKKKDYLGRIILSLLGLILFIFCLLALVAIIYGLFT